MAWNEPGGSGRGKGPSEGPPDLEEIFRQIKNQISRLLGQTKNTSHFSSGGGSNGGFSGPTSAGTPPNVQLPLLIGVVCALLFYAYWGITIIQPGYEGALFRLGRYVETVGPGQHWVAPWFERVEQINVGQVFTVNVSGHQMLTGDENIVSVEVAVSYRIQNIREYVLQLVLPPRFSDPRLEAAARRMGVLNLLADRTMEQVTDSALRQVMGAAKLDAILTTGRGVIALSIQKHMQELISSYEIGIQIENVNLQQISAPDEVKDAFDDVMRAREDQRTLENQANSYAKQVVPEAQGQAVRIEAEAQAYKEQIILKAEGDVARFLKLQEQNQQAPLMVRQQLYLQTMQSVLSKSKQVLLDTAPGSVVYLGLGGESVAPVVPLAQNAAASSQTLEGGRP